MKTHKSILYEEERHRDHWTQAYRFLEGEVGSGRIEPCEWDDEAACYFEVQYPGMYNASSKIRFEDRYLAEKVLRATLDAFNAGGHRKLVQLQHFLDPEN